VPRTAPGIHVLEGEAKEVPVSPERAWRTFRWEAPPNEDAS
jgi:hypothetical protein